MKKLMIVLLLVILIALLGSAYWINNHEAVPVENAGQAVHAPQEQAFLTYKEEEYPLKEHLRTVLLIGTDSTERYEEDENLLLDYYNVNQADFLILLVQDTEANTTEVIQLNRDTMTDVPWLDVIGNYGGTEFQQLCLAFNSGDGGRASCLNTVDAVSSLLFDAPIQHYIQLPMSGISALNNLVGGVPVIIPENLTSVDPAFVKGATVHLTGDQAEKFVRARKNLLDDTNVARMSRQRIYLDSFRKQAQKAFDSDSDFALKLVEKMGEHIQTDLTAQQLSDFVESLDKATISPIRTPDGELIIGTQYYEFFVDEASLWEIVKRAYCQ
jgi:LCP family protein required for cell wall assembly